MSETTTTATAVLHVSDASFQADVLESPDPVLVDFYANWCGPCRLLAPTLEQLADEFQGRATVAKINVDQDVQAALKYRVSGLPTVLLFQKGEVVETLVGVQPKQRYTEALQRAGVA